MVRIYIMILFLFFSIIVNGQEVDTTETFMITFIEEPPHFNGNLKEYIQEELDYPLSAKKDSVEGTVVISFIIDTLGLTTDHTVIKGIREDLNNEALRVSKQIKFDKPALQKGSPIKTEYIVPVVFDLHQLKKKSKSKSK